MSCFNLRSDFITVYLHNNLARLQLFIIVLNCVSISNRLQQAQDVNAVFLAPLKYSLGALQPVQDLVHTFFLQESKVELKDS